MNPTDPMTPVRALIEAAGKITPSSPIAVTALGFATMDATASISQLLSEHDKVVEYIKELKDEGAQRFGEPEYASDKAKLKCAARLQSIVEWK